MPTTERARCPPPSQERPAHREYPDRSSHRGGDGPTKLHGSTSAPPTTSRSRSHPESLGPRPDGSLPAARAHRAAPGGARIDALTGLLNRAAFDREPRRVRRLPPHGQRAQSVSSIPTTSKTLNDRFGHQFGDEVLGPVGATPVTNLARRTTPAAMAGEEPRSSCPASRSASAEGIAERMRIASCPSSGRSPSRTASFGVSRITQRDDDTNVAPRRSARHQRRRPRPIAKRHGCDRVCNSVSALAQASRTDDQPRNERRRRR